MRAFVVNQETKTIVDIVNEITVFFGLKDFVEDIVKDKNCFICGVSPENAAFNNEHVIPNWILRKYNLHAESIDLPNGTSFRYGSYTIPCCQTCNTLLGKAVEIPMSQIFQLSYGQICERLDDPATLQLLFVWMSLIFLKTHLKDTTLLFNRDRRKEEGKIGDLYDWADLHHVHCMARIPYTNAVLGEYVLGSVIVLQALMVDDEDNFYYMDHLPGQSVMIRVGIIAIFCVLNDSGAVMNYLRTYIEKITGPLTLFQLKDFFSHVAYLSTSIKERPKYQSTVITGKYEITSVLPKKPELVSKEQMKVTPGQLLRFYVEASLSQDTPNRDQILQEIEEGKRNYLFDENGDFINHAEKIKET